MSGASRLSRMNISRNRPLGKKQLMSLNQEQMCAIILELMHQVIDLEHAVQTSSCYEFDHFYPKEDGINYKEF